MRAVLVFCPPASATYVPIGIASLASFLREEVGLAPRLVDLNLHAWERGAAAAPALLDCVRGGQGFYDRARYGEAQLAWRTPAQQLVRLGEQARRHAGRELEGPEPELAALLEEQIALVLADDPELVGLSILYPDQVAFAVCLARALRRAAPSLRIIAGGAALSALRPAELLSACPELDALIVGEGEPSIARWLAASPDRVAGLVRREGGAVRCNRRQGAVALDELPPPDFSGLPLARYFNPRPVLPALFSRGCRWRRCRFCAHNASLGRHRRKRAAAFADELAQAVTRFGVRHFYLADQSVEADALDEVSSAILERGLRIAFHVMARPTAEYTEQRLERAAAAGCRWISWGVESGSQRLLDLARKGTRAADLVRVIAAAHAAGISSLAMLIFGLPGSSDEDLAQTLELLEQLYPHLDAVTASRFVLFDGTPFGRHPARYGLEALAAQPLFGRGDRAVHSSRLDHRELCADGSSRPPRASLEVAAWEQRRRWLGELRFDHLPVEHYLLYADEQHAAAGLGLARSEGQQEAYKAFDQRQPGWIKVMLKV